MEALRKEIEETLKRICLLEKRLLGTLTVDSLEVSNALIEAKARLKLLQKKQDEALGTLGKCRKRHAVVDIDLSDADSMNGRGAPDYGRIDTSKPRTIAEIAWLQDIEDLKHGGDAEGIFEGKPLTHFLKLSNPVDKGSSSRGTVVFETGALITNVEEAVDPDALITKIFTNLLERALSGKTKPPDLLNMQFFGDGMANPFYIPMRTPEMNNINALKAQFMQLSTSETLSSIFNNQLAVKICAYWSPSGGNCDHLNYPKVVNTGNKSNNFCLARAILYGKAFLENGGVANFDYIENQLEKDTIELMQNSGLDMDKSSYSLIDAQKLLDTLNGSYRLIIYDEYRQVIMNTSFAQNVIVLQLKNNHYDYIPKLHLFLNVKKICLQCLKEVHPYSHPKNCQKHCFYCMRSGFDKPCLREGTGVRCSDCLFTFPNQDCWNFHKLASKIKQNTLCSMRKLCEVCGKVKYLRDKRHNCNPEGEAVNSDLCQNCEIKHTELAPFCYINPRKPKTPKNVRFAIFDIECFTDGKNHVPITVFCIILCSNCIAAGVKYDAPIKEAPKNCCCGSFNSREHFFTGFDGECPVEKFLDFLFKRSSRKSDGAKTIVMAHNLSKYDGHLVLDSLYKRNLEVGVVCQGFKLFSMEIKLPGKGAIVFKDTLNFFMAPLKVLPKMFQFEQDAKKLFFPHGFNKRENLHTVLPCLPEAEYYWPDRMKPDERSQFMAWYEQNKNTEFCLSRDLKDYNKMDVIVLLHAVVKYREIQMANTGIDPFTASTTIASYSFTVFRANMLKPNMLVNVPERGYRKNELQSEEALKFMRLYEVEHGVTVQDASFAEGEFKVPGTNFRVDGVIRDTSGKVIKCIEYNSCFYHGCMRCFKPDQPLAGGITCQELNAKTEKRAGEIEKQFKIESYWSCEFKERLKMSRKLNETYSRIQVPPRLQLRDSALKGGRVECFKMYHEVTGQEEIRWADVNSLYPYSMKHGIYPIGNPKLYTHESFKGVVWTCPDDNIYRGFILAKILPPKSIISKSKNKIPLLAYSSSNGNLVFCLCRTCADTNSSECGHSDEERSWTAAYTHLELNKSFLLGYKAVEIYEVWDYPEFSEPGGANDLFGEYCNTFLKLKIEASGWPCESAADRKKFMEDYEAKEGIKLDPEKIADNPSQRAVAKLMANSLWGKLAQRTNLSKIEITKSAEAFHLVMSDNTIEVLDICHINDKTDRVVTRKKEEFQKEGKTTCLPVACFVTSQARLKLYEYMEMIEGEILYGDTDSLGHTYVIGQNPLPEGDFLGDMTREHKGKRIIEFICAGPKNYALLMVDENGVLSAHIKIRGFPLNYDASQLLSYQKMKEKIFMQFKEKETPEPIPVDYSIIKRNKKSNLSTVSMIKKWKPVMNKGYVVDNFVVRPWGYTEE